MTNGIRVFLLALIITFAGRADSLSVQATKVIDGSFSITNSLEQNFLLTVTDPNGTGDAYFTPDLRVAGEITLNTSYARAQAYVGTANGGAGLFVPGSGVQYPSASCYFIDPDLSNCRVPFTFGVPETIGVFLEATIGNSCTGGDFRCDTGTLIASAYFGGIGHFIQYYPGVAPAVQFPNATFTLTPLSATPEPGSAGLISLSAVVICFLPWRRRFKAAK